MEKISLHDLWEMKCESEEGWLTAKIPGGVFQTLLDHGRMEDPYYRDNELKALRLMDQNFVFKKHFDVPASIRKEAVIELVFYGIDTIADIFLNDVFLGHAENMHRTWTYSVKKWLKETDNELKVILYSPTKFVEEAYEKEPLEGSEDAMRGFPHLRKAHCMFGWDWGPRLPDAGIFRDVELRGYHQGKIDSVYITQLHEEGCVALLNSLRIQKDGGMLETYHTSDKTYQSKISLWGPDGELLYNGDFKEKIEIKNPRLWWPNGYGEQTLYEIEVSLWQGEEKLDTWKRRIGLRTMTVHREKDAYGESFAHEVNGVQIFAMGADYIPQDCILARITPERTRELLLQAKNAHFNCIRVWGGGYYPEDFFWDICDELGLIVWEDFMFACGVYDLTEEFEENIRQEFIDNIKRIRHHACLGLWCGNNEMEMFMQNGRWGSNPYRKADYIKMYEYLLPKVLKEYDPNTFYWPASPSSGGSFDEPNAENRGDVHYWDVWHGNKPFTEYRKFHFRYVSEFGFQSFPGLKTCESFTRPEERNIFSYVMEKHQRNKTANGKIMNYMEQTFQYPGDFDTVLYASQLLQAEAIRYGVEHFRRYRGRCMGTIIWQLNDNWPVASWSSIDYYGRWKALHYYAKRFFAPLTISCKEEGILTQDTNPNAQPYEVKKSIQLCVCNETRKVQKVEAKWELRSADASIIRSGQEEVTVDPLSSKWLNEETMQDAGLYSDYVSYSLWQEGKVIAEGSVIFCAPKYFQFKEPGLSFCIEGDEIIVSTKAYAKSVEIRNKEEDLLLEDNYFDMNAGEKRVKILKGSREGIRLRSVADIH